MANPLAYLRHEARHRPLHPGGAAGREAEIFAGFASAFGHLQPKAAA
jgi:hypothetical protein